MADIFISYSKADRDKVVMLAAYLESEGWTVWWDKNLGAGDAYRDDIARQLAAARAVIVLWTQTSIKSDFVRAEAGRAKADGKLIPVKEPDVEYLDIPLPFGEMYTESLANRELIRAAVVTQLAKPTVQPSTLRVATKILRYQVLRWMGMVGGAITLFTILSGFLMLADWARWLTMHWHEWTTAFWQWFFSLIHITVPRYWTGLLSFIVFAAMIAVSEQTLAQRMRDISGYLLLIRRRLKRRRISLLPPGRVRLRLVWRVLRAIPIFSFVSSVLLLDVFFFITVLPPMAVTDEFPSPTFWYAFGFVFLVTVGLLLLMIPVTRLSRRLTFLAIGVIILVALNVISLYAPYIREWLKPPIS